MYMAGGPGQFQTMDIEPKITPWSHAVMNGLDQKTKQRSCVKTVYCSKNALANQPHFQARAKKRLLVMVRRTVAKSASQFGQRMRTYMVLESASPACSTTRIYGQLKSLFMLLCPASPCPSSSNALSEKYGNWHDVLRT